MNPIIRVIKYIPAFNAYLNGVMRFNAADFGGALSCFDKCLKHPSFNDELLYSHYGQTLCALGRLSEGHVFLLKACEVYDASGWRFKSEFAFNLAQGSLSALRHVSKHTDIEIRADFLGKFLEGYPTIGGSRPAR